jgi:uncharacterized membrane protein
MAEFNKAIVALVMAVLVIADQLWGISFGHVTEESITIILAVLTPILVWLVPNWPTQRRTLP